MRFELTSLRNGALSLKPVKLVIFDVAGTIIEDHGEVVSCLRPALENNDVLVEECELREWKGASKREVIRFFVQRQLGSAEHSAETRIDRTFNDFRQLLAEQYRSAGVAPIEGAESTFRWLLDRSISIAATTGFDREISELVLRAAGWEHIFTNNISSTDVALGRPAPFMIFRAMEAARVTDVSEVVNIGDTPLDLQAGTNASVMGVMGVLTGVHTKERLRKEPHTHILGSVAALPSVLQAGFGWRSRPAGKGL